MEKLFTRLMDNMDKQLEVYTHLSSCNIKFRESILIRDWIMVNESISLLNELSLKISNLENSRVEILVSIAKQLKSRENEDFFSLISRAPSECKETLLEKYYTLKSYIITAKGIYKGLNDYIEQKKDISKEIIDILVKDSKGNIYTKPGRRDDRGQGFLVDRQL